MKPSSATSQRPPRRDELETWLLDCEYKKQDACVQLLTYADFASVLRLAIAGSSLSEIVGCNLVPIEWDELIRFHDAAAAGAMQSDDFSGERYHKTRAGLLRKHREERYGTKLFPRPATSLSATATKRAHACPFCKQVSYESAPEQR